jgi:AraC-like DNA-binding protein
MPRTFQTSFADPSGSGAITAILRCAGSRTGCGPIFTRRSTSTGSRARKWRLAPRTFLRRFKTATGETPLAYLQRLRTEAAKRMLEEDRLTVQEVSLAVGYEDVAFFGTCSSATPGFAAEFLSPSAMVARRRGN